MLEFNWSKLNPNIHWSKLKLSLFLFDLLPHEYTCVSYLAYIYDLYPSGPMILHINQCFIGSFDCILSYILRVVIFGYVGWGKLLPSFIPFWPKNINNYVRVRQYPENNHIWKWKSKEIIECVCHIRENVISLEK
jgi:hypothetical protein